jgi:hypothetical protein
MGFNSGFKGLTTPPSQWPGKGTAEPRTVNKAMRQDHELFGFHLEGDSPPVPNNGASILSLLAKGRVRT